MAFLSARRLRRSSVEVSTGQEDLLSVLQWKKESASEILGKGLIMVYPNPLP
jgi:hypothetical protein